MTGPLAGSAQSLPTLGKRLALPALAAPSLMPQLPLPAPLQVHPDQGQGDENGQQENSKRSQQSTPPRVFSLRLGVPKLRKMTGGVSNAALNALLLPILTQAGIRG